MIDASNLASFIGFTENEVKELCKQYNMDFDGLRTSIIEILSGSFVEVDVTSFQNDMTSFNNKDDILTYLIYLGYLAYNQKTQTAFIPNEEIRQELIKATKRKKWDELLVFQRESDELLNATLEMDGRVIQVDKKGSIVTFAICGLDKWKL